jgi:hypothetical protein
MRNYGNCYDTGAVTLGISRLADWAAVTGADHEL